MAFKVKTTAPKIYCVRPNASILEPGASLKVSIILQGFSQPLPEDYKCKDKFLLVSVPCPGLSDPLKVGESWSSLESKNKLQLVSKKLRVSYVIGKDQNIDSEPAATVHKPVAQGDNGHERSGAESASNSNSNTHSNANSNANANGNGHGGITGGIAAGAAGAAAAVGAAVGYNSGHQNEKEGYQNQNHQNNQNNQGYQAQNQGYNQGYQGYNQGHQGQGQGYGNYGKVEGYPSAAESASGMYAASRLDKTQPQSDLQKELEASNARIAKLADKLDALEGGSGRSKQFLADAVQGVSLPVAILLVIIAFLIGWLLF